MVAILLLVVVILAGLFWLGLRIPPAPFDPFPGGAVAFETVPLPADLPAPVERYYRELYGDEAPVITSAVISGRARMRPGRGDRLQRGHRRLRPRQRRMRRAAWPSRGLAAACISG